jgi:hypothetical protein
MKKLIIIFGLVIGATTFAQTPNNGVTPMPGVTPGTTTPNNSNPIPGTTPTMVPNANIPGTTTPTTPNINMSADTATRRNNLTDTSLHLTH